MMSRRLEVSVEPVFNGYIVTFNGKKFIFDDKDKIAEMFKDKLPMTFEESDFIDGLDDNCDDCGGCDETEDWKEAIFKEIDDNKGIVIGSTVSSKIPKKRVVKKKLAKKKMKAY